MFMRLLDAMSPYYLLHIIIDGVQANAFIAGRLGKFAADQRARGRNLVIVNAWRIPRRDFLALQNARPANVEVSGGLRAPMPEDAPRTAAGSPLDRPVGPVAGA